VLQTDFAGAAGSLEVSLPSLSAVWVIGDAGLAERWPCPVRFPTSSAPAPEA
jgi:hypothetical protein